MKTWKILGENDDQSVCDQCGKSNLSKVVWMENNTTQQVMAVGVVCASKLSKQTTKEIKEELKSIEKKKRQLKDKINNITMDATLKFRDEWCRKNNREAVGSYSDWSKEWYVSPELKLIEELIKTMEKDHE